MPTQSCVDPGGRFVYGLHKPSYRVANLRLHDRLVELGRTENGEPCRNRANFPADAVTEECADWIYEIPNPLPFRGRTYISKSWADTKAGAPERIKLPSPGEASLAPLLRELAGDTPLAALYARLPDPVRLALAACSTDPEELAELARLSCEFLFDPASGRPQGLIYHGDLQGRRKALVHDLPLFEVVVNNPRLPNDYREVMVLRPGVQGTSEIVGEYGSPGETSHIYEYLRRNSYIPWGHYAANMAEDAVRYSIDELTATDMTGLRHLYYQRTFVRLAEELGLDWGEPRRLLSVEELEALRLRIVARLAGPHHPPLTMDATLWGWNFGFDYSSSHYRLHASHQQIHQQFALLPAEVACYHDAETPAPPLASYSSGDLVAEFIERYQTETGTPFFDAYLAAIAGNRRMDGRRDLPASLVIHEDDHTMLFVPKAQTSQWEIQLVTRKQVGNVLEADSATRDALDRSILLAQKILARLGARLVTSIEFPKRLAGGNPDQRLLYAFLPKLPYSMGAFSEAQHRFINGHYPEDFAAACRSRLAEAEHELA